MLNSRNLLQPDTKNILVEDQRQTQSFINLPYKIQTESPSSNFNSSDQQGRHSTNYQPLTPTVFESIPQYQQQSYYGNDSRLIVSKIPNQNYVPSQQSIQQLQAQVSNQQLEIKKLNQDLDDQSRKMRLLIMENDKLSTEFQSKSFSRRDSVPPIEQIKIKTLVADLENKVQCLILENEKLNTIIQEQEEQIDQLQDTRVDISTNSNGDQIAKQFELFQQKNNHLLKQIETQTSLISSYKQENNRLQQSLQNKLRVEQENLELKYEIKNLKEELNKIKQQKQQQQQQFYQ